jgi:hypothetical protein
MTGPTPRFVEIFFEVFEALAVLDEIVQEPEMHRRYSDYYAYEFFVARRRE